MQFIHIVAADKLGAIGYDGGIPWNCHTDLKHFKETSMGHPLIMGRKTYESLPESKLPGRKLIVVSTTLKNSDVVNHAIVANSLSQAFDMATRIARCDHRDRVYIVGGARIYEQTAKSIHGVIFSRVDICAKHADAYYPALALDTMQQIRSKILETKSNEPDVRVIYYQRI